MLLNWLSCRDINEILRNAILYKKHAVGACGLVVEALQLFNKRITL